MVELDKGAFRGEMNDYTPKLTNRERLGIIAMHREGVTLPVLALAFGVNRRTLSKLVNNHPKYADIKEEASKHKPDQLYALYVTDEMVTRVNKVIKQLAGD